MLFHCPFVSDKGQAQAHRIPEKTGRVYVVKRSLFDTNQDAIVHQVNCQGAMGSGIAADIRKRFPQHYTDYINKVHEIEYRNLLLGSIVQTKNQDTYDVIGMFSQFNYGTGKKHTDYLAFKYAFNKVCELHDKIAVPYGIGCGLGGGNWKDVYAIIEFIAKNHENVTVEICKPDKRKFYETEA